MIPVETVPGIRMGEKEQWRGEFKYDIFIHYKNFCKFHSVPPSSTTLK
jgi:hypothetical protein